MERKKGIPLMALIIFIVLLVAIIITCVVILGVKKSNNKGNNGEVVAQEENANNTTEQPSEDEEGEEITNEDIINQDEQIQKLYALTGNNKTFAKYAIYASGGFDQDNDNIKNDLKLQLAMAQVTNADMGGSSSKSVSKSKIEEYNKKIFTSEEAEKTTYSDFSLYDSDTNFTDIYKTIGYVYNSNDSTFEVKESEVTEDSTPSQITELITKVVKYDSKIEIYVKPIFVRTFYSPQIDAVGCEILGNYDFQLKEYPQSDSLIAIAYSDYEQVLKSDYAKDIDNYKFSEFSRNNIDLNKVSEYKYTFTKEDNDFKLKAFEKVTSLSEQNNSSNDGPKEMTAQEKETFNSKISSYVGNQMRGSEVKSLYDVIVSLNTENEGTSYIVTTKLNGEEAEGTGDELLENIKSQKDSIDTSKTYSVDATYKNQIITTVSITEN